MKKCFFILSIFLTINSCYSIDFSIPLTQKQITIDTGPIKPHEVLKWHARKLDKATNKIKQDLDKLQFWKEEAKKQEKAVPENIPYNYNELLSVDNQDIFTKINGHASQISVGKNNKKMSVWIIGIDGIPYEYNPSNKTHNLSWIKQSKNKGVKQIAVAEDGTLTGINENGNIVILQNNKWKPASTKTDNKMAKMTAEGSANFHQAKDIGIVNAKEIVYLNKDGKIYKSTNSGSSWNSLPTLEKEEKFENVSIGADGTIAACTKNNKAYLLNGKNWQKLPTEIKQIAIGSKTNLIGISKDNDLVIFDINKNKWKIAKNLVDYSKDKNKSIKVKDVAINSSGNIWAILPNNEIITNIAANTNKALKKLKQGRIVTISSLSEDKLLKVETKEKNYLKPTGTDPDDTKTQFKIIRSGQCFGLQSLDNKQFIESDPNEGLGEYKGSIKLSPDFANNERWLISGELEQATLTDYASKKNLATVPLEEIITKLRNERMEQIKKFHDDAMMAAVIAGTVVGYFTGTPAPVVAATAVEFQRQRSVAEVEDLTDPILNNPGLSGKIVMAYLVQTDEEEEEFLPAMFDIQIHKEKAKQYLTEKSKEFKIEQQFDTPGKGDIKFKAKGYPVKFWLWDKNKKLINPGIIGGNNNTTVSIGTTKGWKTFARKDEILKPETSKPFWISIEKNKLTFGSGSMIGLTPMGSTKEIKDLSKIKYVTFSKLPGSDAEISEVKFFSKLLGTLSIKPTAIYVGGDKVPKIISQKLISPRPKVLKRPKSSTKPKIIEEKEKEKETIEEQSDIEEMYEGI